MRKISRLFLFGSLILMLLTAACGAEQGATPTLAGTLLPDEETSTPAVDTTGTAETETATTAETPTEALETATATESAATQPAATDTTQTPGTQVVPVTGPEILLIECQFCVDTVAHALLVMPDTATFTITSPPASSTTSSTSVTATTPTCNTVEVNNGKQVVLCSGPEMTPLTLNICTNGTTCTDFPVDLLACPLAQATAAPGDATATSTSSVVISTATPLAGATATVTVTPTP